jgi:hypothetical protein
MATPGQKQGIFAPPRRNGGNPPFAIRAINALTTFRY